ILTGPGVRIPHFPQRKKTTKKAKNFQKISLLFSFLSKTFFKKIKKKKLPKKKKSQEKKKKFLA
ncbi:MAG: hypothetical protein UH077_00440, partial [Bacteroidales bacterium]|nr:hypothetical protein [Bacteroidales bacterium]